MCPTNAIIRPRGDRTPASQKILLHISHQKQTRSTTSPGDKQCLAIWLCLHGTSYCWNTDSATLATMEVFMRTVHFKSLDPERCIMHLSAISVYKEGAPRRSQGAGRRIAGQLWLSDGLCVRACVWAPWGRGFNPCCPHVFPRELWCPIFTVCSFSKSNRDPYIFLQGILVKHVS